MKNIFTVMLIAVLLPACTPAIDSKVTRKENSFRNINTCAVNGNYIQEHNSGNVKFSLSQLKNERQTKIYFIDILTEDIAHDFPRDAVMLLTLDNNPPIKLYAFNSDKAQSTRYSYVPGYVIYGAYPRYVPGYTIRIDDRSDLASFIVTEPLIQRIAASKKVMFYVEGRSANLQGTFVEGNFETVNNFVSQCIQGKPAPKS